MSYRALYERSIQERDTYWAEQAARIDWHRPFDQVCDYHQPPFAKWFVGGQTNLCHNAVDRHLAARPDQAALIAAAEEEVDSTPMEGFDPAKVDEILGLAKLGLRSVILLPLGYRETEGDWLVNLKKVRRPREQFVTEV